MKYLMLVVLGMLAISCTKSPEGIIIEITQSLDDRSVCWVQTDSTDDCCYGTLYMMPCRGLQIGDTVRVQVMNGLRQ